MLADDSYVLGRTSDEYQRLERQAVLWQPLALRMLKETGLKPGMKCLDVGCGTGNVMRLMGGIAGKEGSVTGIDMDERIGKEALGIMRAQGDCNYYFTAGDITRPGVFDAAAYDVVYTRFVLVHQTDPVSVVHNLYAAVKPGGTLLVQDYDFMSIRSNDKTAAITNEMRSMLIEVFTRTGKDPEAGMHLSNYFEDAGIGSPDGTDASSIITPAPDFINMAKAVTLSMKNAILSMNVWTPEKLEAFIQKTDEKCAELKGYYYTWPMVNSAWKHKK